MPGANRRVIVDTSPLLYLHQLGLLHLLPDVVGSSIVPVAVADELAEGRRLGVAAPDPADYSWIEVRQVPGAAILPLAWDLGSGEREVLALALGMPGALVVLDDRLARRAAQILGIPLVGTLGLLLNAKQLGLIPAVKPLLDHLDRLNFRVDAETRRHVLRLAEEQVEPGDGV